MEERYRSIVEYQTEFICRFLPDCTLTFVNEAYARNWGKTPQEMIGINFLTLIPESFRENMRKYYTSFTIESSIKTVEHEVLLQNGAIRWQRWTDRAFFDNEGNLIEFQGVGRDITERKHAEEALQESEVKHRAIFENTGTATLIIEEDMTISLTNMEFEKISGHKKQEVENKMPFTVFVHHEDLERLKKYHLLRRADPDSAPRNYRAKLVDRRGNVKDVFATVSMIPNTKKSLVSILDITEHKKMEDKLTESEAKYRTLTEGSLTGIFIHQDGKFVFVNDRFAEIHGYKADELIGEHHLKLIHPDEREMLSEMAERRLRGEPIPQRYEVRRLRKDGTTVWCEMMASLIQYHGKPAIMGNVIDITDIKEAEEELKSSHEQLHNLYIRLQTVREEERILLAREIHDELGQVMTGLKMDLSWLENRLSRSGDKTLNNLLGKTRSMTSLVESTIKTIRRIAAELRPGVLDDLGLVAAIEWQAQDFQSRTGIECKFITSLEQIELCEDYNTALFRILQETLTNVVRHAEATQVMINLNKKDDKIILEVKDNGKGIPEKQVFSSKSLGLLGMKERAQLFGGEVNITGKKGKGTRVMVRIPIDYKDKK